MITDNEKFIEIQGILSHSDISSNDCIKINNLIIELSKENQELKEKTKLFHKNRVFSLEYDKETLRDMILEYQEEIERLNNIINEFDSWLKEKKEQMEEFELYKRKETGAFWYSTMGNIETFIERIQELKGSDKE